MGCMQMKRKILFLMCGPAGSGKTTYVKKQMENAQYHCVHVSRDEVRAEFLSDEDKNMFKYEDDVFDEFCKRIDNALHMVSNEDVAVFADATHLSEKARNRVLDKLNLANVDICPVVFDLSLQTTLDQNELRKGVNRAYVPRSVIRRMYYTYEKPTENEKYKYKDILYVKEGDK